MNNFFETRLSKNVEIIEVKEINENNELSSFQENILKLDTTEFKILFAQINNLEELAVLPKENEQYRIITTQMFNAISFLSFILTKEKVKEIYIVIYSLGEKATKVIEKILEDDLCESMTLLISSLRNNTVSSKENFVKEIKKRNHKKLNLIYSYSHAKILLCETEKNNFYVLEGSGNFNNNARIEQYLFENNQTVYNFHKSWIKNIKNITQKKDTIIYE